MAIITITSDYGLTDPYLPALKGALYSEAEGHQVVDISHALEPGNLMQAAFVLGSSYASFPEGTVHLVAFGEITANRKLLAAQMDGHYFLMADHGMLGIINPKRKLTNTVEIDLKQEPGLFPARDILARSAGFLANGGQIGMLGRTASQIEKATLPRPRTANDQSSILGSIIYIDNFGNLISNITRTRFYKVGKQRSFRVLLPRNKSINSISQSYYDKSKGSLLALFNSHGLLEVAISGSRGKDFNGANTLLGIEVQNSITIEFE